LTTTATRKLSKNRQQQLFENLNVEINSFFTTAEIEHLARKAKFVQRENAVKLDGATFLALIVFHSESLKKQSLNDLTIDLQTKHGIEITKQSLHERFNDFAIAFLTKTLTQLLRKQLSINRLSVNCERFRRILIKDSVCFQIDDSLKQIYPGSGGSGSAAAIRIQLEYDLLGGTITDLSIHAFNEQDASDSLATIEKTQTGDLIIRDLGYMKLEVLRTLIKKLVLFICRVNPVTKIYELKHGKLLELNFVKIKRHMIKHNMTSCEKDVYLSRQRPVHVRLIIYILPEEVVNERLRKVNRNNKKKGRKQCTKEYRVRSAFNLFITNGSSDDVPMDKIYQFYKLRWQIELMFKVWKSLCAIHQVKKVNRYRLECYLYSRLIFIVLAWQVIWITATLLFSIDKEPLSYFKIYKTLLRRMLDELKNIFFSETVNIKIFIWQLYRLSKTKHLLEKKKNKSNSWEILITCIIS
jgi:hypothetical protein